MQLTFKLLIDIYYKNTMHNSYCHSTFKLEWQYDFVITFFCLPKWQGFFQYVDTDLGVLFSSYTKAQTFADCVGHELPYGWEECVDRQIGIYYVDHINSKFDLRSIILVVLIQQ